MSKQNYQKIEDIFKEALTGDVLENALDLAEYTY